jgi:hypothetical protein
MDAAAPPERNDFAVLPGSSTSSSSSSTCFQGGFQKKLLHDGYVFHPDVTVDLISFVGIFGANSAKTHHVNPNNSNKILKAH